MQDLVLKIGGSLLSPSLQQLFDFSYALRLRDLFSQYRDSYRIWVAIGGGQLNRHYQSLASEHGEEQTVDLHRIGVAATNLNAEVFHGLLDDLCRFGVVRYQQYEDFMQNGLANFPPELGSVVVVGGAQPGQSNDWNALQIARKLGVSRVIDVKNVDGVYSADPRQDPEAVFMPRLSWQQYLEVIGNPAEHVPGGHYPVDPVTAREAATAGVEFVIVGANLANLQLVIAHEQDFRGSVISG